VSAVCLLADREFIGKDWFAWLDQHGIAPCIRLPASATIGSSRFPIWAAFKKLEPGEIRFYHRAIKVYGVSLRVAATKNNAGETLYLAYRGWAKKNLNRYAQRWQTERTFGSLKVRGFDLERTGVTQPARLERLFGLVILAWVACLRTGVWLDTQRPIKKKKHGRRAMSLVRYGAESLTNGLRWRLEGLEAMLSVLIRPFPAPGAA